MKLTDSIIKDLLSFSSEKRKSASMRFFKTAKGEYGEGDRFHGISVPDQRAVAKLYYERADHITITQMLDSDFHEERLTGIFMLVHKFNQGQKKGNGKEWVDLFIKKIDRVNNWDIVDSSAYQILGKWLEDKDRDILYKMANHHSLWRNRIAIVATKHFINKLDFKDLLSLSEHFLSHQHDLIHKATGWMLREAWQKDPKPIESFLKNFSKNMPRTMLRYTIEKMNPEERKKYLQR